LVKAQIILPISGASDTTKKRIGQVLIGA